MGVLLSGCAMPLLCSMVGCFARLRGPWLSAAMNPAVQYFLSRGGVLQGIRAGGGSRNTQGAALRHKWPAIDPPGPPNELSVCCP